MYLRHIVLITNATMDPMAMIELVEGFIRIFDNDERRSNLGLNLNKRQKGLTFKYMNFLKYANSLSMERA